MNVLTVPDIYTEQQYDRSNIKWTLISELMDIFV